jgi:predicted 2-oxoglutarate/Fe(II)-dependent dioxygenase YbiX
MTPYSEINGPSIIKSTYANQASGDKKGNIFSYHSSSSRKLTPSFRDINQSSIIHVNKQIETDKSSPLLEVIQK